MMKIPAILLAMFLVLAGVGCARATGYQSLEAGVPTISVQGTGKVEAEPDEAIVRFGVMSEDKYLAKAYKLNTESMNSVISAIKSMGIDSKDIKTSSYTVTPVYERDEKGWQVPGKPATFRVQQQLTIKLRDTSGAGEVIDRIIASGTNVFNGIQFTSSKLEDLRTQAKVKAAKDAREKAVLLAKSLDVKLGRVLRINASISQPYPVRNQVAFEAAAARSVPRIEAGSMEVTSTCNVVYEVLQ